MPEYTMCDNTKLFTYFLCMQYYREIPLGIQGTSKGVHVHIFVDSWYRLYLVLV